MLESPRPAIVAALLGAILLTSAVPAFSRPIVDPDLLDEARERSRIRLEGTTASSVRVVSPAIEIEHGVAWADVWMMGRIDPEAVRALGGRVQSIAGAVMTARIPLDAATRLDGVAGLERVQLAQTVDLQADMLVAETGVDDQWGGPPPGFSYGGTTGRNVVVGVVDTGIDPYHADFWTAAGTRIRYLWDQTIGTGTRPAGFTYGSEYSALDINARTCPSNDTQGHGTHIAGVAAGNGRATGNGQAAYRYMGVAPEADLVIVKLRAALDGSITDDKVLDGVRYVFERAAAMGKPASVVLAVGKTTGPHDGQDPFDLGISALTGPGRIVCAAAGNYGGEGRHAEWRPSVGARSGSMSFTIPPFTPSSVGLDILKIEGWYDAEADYTVSIVTPLGQTIGPVARGAATEVFSPAGIVKITNGAYTSAGGAQRLDLQISRGNVSYPQVATGTWTILVVAGGSALNAIDAWITGYALGAVKPSFTGGMTERCLIASPATADQVISVAAYSTRRYWTAVNGRTYGLSDAVVGAIAPSSSPGPRRDGARLPHLAAPGHSVASSRSSSFAPSTMYLMLDGVHVIRWGTSVAAAGMAGTVALKLQGDPTMSPDRAARHRVLSASDSYTGPVPNDHWGWGKLRFPQPVAGVGDAANTGPELALVSENPASGSVTFEVRLESPGAARESGIRIVDVNGREVAALDAAARSGPQRLTWSGRTRSGSKAPAGVYWARLRTPGKSRPRSFVWLR